MGRIIEVFIRIGYIALLSLLCCLASDKQKRISCRFSSVCVAITGVALRRRAG
jgi:hypothetical protein